MEARGVSVFLHPNAGLRHEHVKEAPIIILPIVGPISHQERSTARRGERKSNDVDPLGRNLTCDTTYFPGKYILDGFVINHRGPRAGVYSFKTMSVA
jgi:hypothetical protein